MPWESSEGGLFGRWWATMTAINFKGRPFFSAAAAEGKDAMPAVLFSTVTGALLGAVFGTFFLIALSIGGAAMANVVSDMKGGAAAAPRVGLTGVGLGVALLVGAIVVCTIGGFIGPWLLGGLHHLALLIVGAVGEGRGYGDTVRVSAYAQAGSYLWLPIPVIGSLIAIIFNLMGHVSGYDEVHRCGEGKAFLAWLSPLLMSCCGCCLWFGAMLSL